MQNKTGSHFRAAHTVEEKLGTRIVMKFHSIVTNFDAMLLKLHSIVVKCVYLLLHTVSKRNQVRK